MANLPIVLDQDDELAIARFQERLRLVDLANASLGKNPNYPAMQVNLRKQVTRAAKTSASPFNPYWCLKWFGLHAKAFLTVVTDAKSLGDYVLCLDEFIRNAWREYGQIPLEMITPSSGEQRVVLDKLLTRKRHWISEGWKAVVAHASREASQPANETAQSSSGQGVIEPQSGAAPKTFRTSKKEARCDARLLGAHSSVSYETASKYAGVTDRRIRQLVNEGSFKTVGAGHSKRILVEDLKRHFPPDGPKK